jgi:hypothetical protein
VTDIEEEGAKFVLSPRPQGYGPALEQAWAELKDQTDEGVINRKGGYIGPDGKLCVKMLGDEFCVDRSDKSVTWNGQEAPPFFSVLILHYLTDLSAARPSGEWISFRELEGGDFYFPAFAARTIVRLKTVFAGREKELEKAARKLDGEQIRFGDAAASFRVLPNVVIAVVLHEACEDFPNEANVLFDAACREILPTEDLAVVASLLVSKVCKSLQ